MKNTSFTVILIAFMAALGFAGLVVDGQASHDGPANPHDTESPFKGTAHVLQNPGTPDGRDGGETIEDAIVIPTLPFQDSGNTCDNLDDYDEVCPYSGSTSPDVVYAYTPTEDILVDLDLCSEGNEYDTKLYVYNEGPGNLVACNDDFCVNSWTTWASRLEQVFLASGFTYYIVIDGYGGDCGNFDLYIEQSPDPVFPECVEDYFVPEGEPPLVDGYVDNYNGGCNSEPPVFQHIHWVDDETWCANLCGVSGWYNMPTGLYRDTDWFQIMPYGWEISGTIVSAYTTQILVSYPNSDCFIYYDWIIFDIINAHTVYEFSFATSSYGDIYWLWIGPADWEGTEDFVYELQLCGHWFGTIPVENASWGKVKSRYR